MASVYVQDKCEEVGHSFEYVDYVPDFDHRCYTLQFQCENCGVEVFDKVNESKTENNHIDISDTLGRYLKKSSQRQQPALRKDITGGGIQ